MYEPREDIPVLVITGKSGSGKTTIANYLKSKYPENVYESTFARLLKCSLNVIGLIDSIEPDKTVNLKDFDGYNVRNLLQDFAIYCRNIDDNIFCKCLYVDFYLNYHLKLRNYKVFVVSDMRFETEYNWIMEKFPNKYIIKIENPSDNLDPNHAHFSEQFVDNKEKCKVDCTFFNNNDGLDFLKKKVDKFFITDKFLRPLLTSEKSYNLRSQKK